MRRAIVVVPGLQRLERFAARDTLVRGLLAQECRRYARGDDVSLDGEVGVRLEPKAASDGPPTDVFEAYWARRPTNRRVARRVGGRRAPARRAAEAFPVGASATTPNLRLRPRPR